MHLQAVEFVQAFAFLEQALPVEALECINGLIKKIDRNRETSVPGKDLPDSRQCPQPNQRISKISWVAESQSGEQDPLIEQIGADEEP